MLKPDQILDKYYLEARRDLLEIAALLDRYDAAVERGGSLPQKDKINAVLYKSLLYLGHSNSSTGSRTETLLDFFSEI